FFFVVIVSHEKYLLSCETEPCLSTCILEQIQQREEKDPDQINEVPIQADVFQNVGLARVELLGQDQHEREQTDRDVNRMEAGHQEVGAGPHVAAGNHHRQAEPLFVLVQAAVGVDQNVLRLH